MFGTGASQKIPKLPINIRFSISLVREMRIKATMIYYFIIHPPD